MSSARQAAAPAREGRASRDLRSIGEVADELHVPQHVLRSWETQFPELRPTKRSGRRHYGSEDVALLRRIATLVYGEHHTVSGARRLLHGQAEEPAGTSPTARPGLSARLRPVLAGILEELVRLRTGLS